MELNDTKSRMFLKKIVNNKIIRFLDSSICFLLGLLKPFYKFKVVNYGIKEAIVWSREVDVWWRYSKIVREVKICSDYFKDKKIISILEVGSGGEGIANFLRFESRFNIIAVDINKEKLRTKYCLPVVGDGCNLPFKENQFDIVVSIDSIEHVQKKQRLKYLKELLRVANNVILIHVPLFDPENGFLSRDFDMKFQHEHLRIFGFPEPNINEHLSVDSVTLNEVREVFQDIIVEYSQNAEVWLKYMIMERIPIIGSSTGLCFLLFWRRKNVNKPYYAALIKRLKWKSSCDNNEKP